MFAGSADVLSNASTLAELPLLRAAGVQSIAVDIMLMQDNLTSSTVYAGEDTASDASIAAYVAAVRGAGMNATLKLIVVPVNGSWIYAAPAAPPQWFASYGDWVVHYADIAAASGAARLCIGTELAHLTVHAEYGALWTDLIVRVRTAQPALELTYAALFVVEYPRVPFWQLLDAIGIDAYYAVANASMPHPPVSDMVRVRVVHAGSVVSG
jgi:hypothetical protein